MREQHRPGIADPVVKADAALGGIGGEIRGDVVNLKSHCESPLALCCRDVSRPIAAGDRAFDPILIINRAAG
jgi:hypothetical protein